MKNDDRYNTGRNRVKERKAEGSVKSILENEEQIMCKTSGYSNKQAVTLSNEESIDLATIKAVPPTNEVDRQCGMLVDLQQAFATFSPLLCGASDHSNVSYARDEIILTSQLSAKAGMNIPFRPVNNNASPKSKNSRSGGIGNSAQADAKTLSKNAIATASIETRSEEDGCTRGEDGDNFDNHYFSREENKEQVHLASSSRNFSSSKLGTNQKNDSVIQLSIEKGNGKRKEDIVINLDSAHFIGWDGSRSHYMLEQVASSASKQSSARDESKIPAHDRSYKGQANQKNAPDQKLHERNQVESTQLKSINPSVHPLHYPDLDGRSDIKCLVSQLPVMHIFSQQQHQFVEEDLRIESDSGSSFSSSSSCNSRETSVGNISQNFFSLFAKLAFNEKTKRKHKPRKQTTNTGKINEKLDPRKLPMGEEEREIIIGFLGSSSYSGTRAMSVPDCGKFPEESSLPSSSFVFMEKNGMLCLKPHGENDIRKLLSLSNATFTIPKKPCTGHQPISRLQQHSSALKPGWRANAQKDISRMAITSQTAISFSSSRNSRIENQNSASKQHPSLTSSSSLTNPDNLGQPTFSTGHHSAHENLSSQVPYYYFNIFGIPAATETKSRCNSEEGKKSKGVELENSCLKKCVPSFHTLLRKRKSTAYDQGCLLEGWVAFFIGGPFDAANRHWRNGQRDCLRYLVIHGGSPLLFAYDSVDALAASKSIDLSRGRVIEPLLVSKQFGYAVVVKSESTGKTLCTLLPLNLGDSFFTDNGFWQIVDQNSFAKKWKVAYPRPKAKWGDSDCLECFSLPNQNEAFLHLYFTISNVVKNKSKYGERK